MERLDSWTSYASDSQQNDGLVMTRRVDAEPASVPAPCKDLSAVGHSYCVRHAFSDSDSRVCDYPIMNKSGTSPLCVTSPRTLEPTDPS